MLALALLLPAPRADWVHPASLACDRIVDARRERRIVQSGRIRSPVRRWLPLAAFSSVSDDAPRTRAWERVAERDHADPRQAIGVSKNGSEAADTATSSSAPKGATLVLVSLILVAAVANLNLAVANVALPSIAEAFDSGQTALNLIAVGYSLGLAASVLYFGALGDRYGRKLMLVLGMALSIPACLLAAWAPSDEVLFLARLLGGLSAGMAFPTTLALITALWAGPGRTKAIALWSGIGGAISSLGPVLAGALLEEFWWGSVFLLTLPLAVVALVMALRFVPSHVNEATDPVDNLGGILSVVLVAALVLAINFAAVPNKGALTLGLAAIALAGLIAFLIRQRAARNPLYDLRVAARRVFWVAACAGLIVFGTLMGAMFIGQQFLQNVLGYSTLQAGLAILPAAFAMVLVAPRSAKIVEARGARFTLLIGYAFCLLGFLTMLLLWNDGIAYWKVGVAYALVGVGVGFAGTPASHSLTGSVPVTRAGMASGTADLQRDLGGAIMQSILGALLTAGYASAIGAAIAAAPNRQEISDNVENQLTKSFAGAEEIAQQHPQYSSEITAAAKESFLDGADWAYTAGIVAILLGAILVFFLFPRKEAEEQLLARYHAEDTAAAEESRAPRPGRPQPASR
jgi:MFS transporter, DHA2 family, multidrug resistance protein